MNFTYIGQFTAVEHGKRRNISNESRRFAATAADC